MNIDSVAVICFSPTNTTRSILYAVCQGLQVKRPRLIDLTFADNRQRKYGILTEDLVIIGVPVYEETIPEIILDSLKAITGKGQPIILVAVYGNVGFGMTLKHLDIWARNANFIPLAAGSFIGEHSFSNEQLLVANGRPNANDLEIARNFGGGILERLNLLSDITKLEALHLPGHLPLMARILPQNSAKLFTKAPLAEKGHCNACGICVKGCPAAAIDNVSYAVDEEKCLRCFACVRKCPKKARHITFKKKWLVHMVLGHKTKVSKQPMTFLL